MILQISHVALSLHVSAAAQVEASEYEHGMGRSKAYAYTYCTESVGARMGNFISKLNPWPYNAVCIEVNMYYAAY